MAKREGARPSKSTPKRSVGGAARRAPQRSGNTASAIAGGYIDPGGTVPNTASYKHIEATTPLRPEVGTQAQFRKKKPPTEYRYDSSLSPAADWDATNPVRDLAQWLIATIDEASRLPPPDPARGEPPFTFEARRVFRNGRGDVVARVRSLADAVEQLKRIERPFLNWSGKAERQTFEVPTLPLFVHERLSTKAVLETLKGHKRDRQMEMFDLFGDPQHSVADQVLRAYEHQDEWQNRMILGDSLVVMNSLLRYEGLGGQVQMIYMDPPYGVKFGSNFQPFVRKRDVKHNDDEDMTREPEMVKAYRDTWELGLHSYLTYMRDRLLLARELLSPSGSVFVQIGAENVHHVREVLDDVFGESNIIGNIAFKKTAGQTSRFLAGTSDYILWYARDRERTKYRSVFTRKNLLDDEAYAWVELQDGTRRRLTDLERSDLGALPVGARAYTSQLLQSQRQGRPSGPGSAMYYPFAFEGRTFYPVGNRGWTTTISGMERLKQAGRILLQGMSVRYLRYFDDFPVTELTDLWADTQSGSAMDRFYVVQTTTEVVRRCMLMTTDPGDLVLDPTCGSGTTAYVAEQWGRRWITIDTSRVPLALARQRLLTATFPYYELKEEKRGPAGGFVYKRKRNQRGEEVGGIVPHVTLKSIANDEPPDEEVLVDRPETVGKITRVTGPFVVEATIPTPIDWDEDGQTDSGTARAHDHGSFVDRMIEVLRQSPVLHLGGNKTVNLRSVRRPAKTLSLSAEAVADDFSHRGVEPTQGSLADESRRKPVAIVFGPESGAVANKLVENAAREAHGKNYAHLYVIGFAIEASARKTIDVCEQVFDVPATYVQATPDLMMGDLLKNMRSSQIFSVCGLPEIRLANADATELVKMGIDPKDRGAGPWHQVELLGLDVFDPATMEVDHRRGDDVPCWMLDSDYNGNCFRATQVFFPRTAAWDDLRRALKAEYAESVWDHLAGTTSGPFQVGGHGQVAVKVIDDRGNELLVVKDAKEAS